MLSTDWKPILFRTSSCVMVMISRSAGRYLSCNRTGGGVCSEGSDAK